jgi:hypothetical protein
MSAMRVAVVGGDGRFRPEQLPGAEVRIFLARRYGGNRGLRDLVAAVQAGGVDRVVVLARWNSHSTTCRVLRVCRRRRVPVEVWP